MIDTDKWLKQLASKLERKQAEVQDEEQAFAAALQNKIVNNLIECATHGHDLALETVSSSLETFILGYVTCKRCGCFQTVGWEEEWKLSREYCSLDDDIQYDRYEGGYDEHITLTEFLSRLESDDE